MTLTTSPTSTPKSLRRFAWAGLCLLLLLLPACGDPASSDAADLPDGDSLADGDAATPGVGASCLLDGDCLSELACDPIRFECRERECKETDDCLAALGEAHACLPNGLCIPAPCVRADECPETHYCRGGYCARTPDCSQIADLAITPVTPYLRSGGTRDLTAYVTDLSGRVVPSDVPMLWQSLNPDVVSVQPYPDTPAKAQAKGGETFGTTTIVATLRFETEGCGGRELTATVTLQNFPTHAHGLRILVMDSGDETLIGGATVLVNGQTALTPSDADKGVALFDGVEPPFDVHIFHPDYHYLSLIQVNSHDILAPLSRFYGQNKRTGISLELGYQAIPPVRHGDTRFGLAGMAYTRSLLNLHIGSLFSEPLVTDLLSHGDLAVPSNVSLDETTKPEEVGPTLLVAGEADSTFAWGLGGYLSGDDMAELVTTRLLGGWTDLGAYLLTALAFSGSYYFGTTTDVVLTPSAMVPDNGENLSPPLNGPDLNGNGQQDDYIPNYDSFTRLDAPLSLSESLNQQVVINTGVLPIFGSRRMDGVFALVGKRPDGRQFVPLGIGTRHVASDGTGDKPSIGKGGELRVSFAPLNGGDLHHDQYVVIAYAMPFSSVFSPDVARPSVSAILHRSDASPQTVEMGDFMPFVPWAYVYSEERRVQFYPVESANLHRIGFVREGREWEILVGTGDAPAALIEVILPTPPGHDPFGPEVAVTAAAFHRADAERKEGGEPPVSTSLDDLAEFNAKPLSWLDRYVKRFSSYHFDQRK